MMKMITAIVNKKDAGSVCDNLREQRIAFTKMASTGGFLKTGNVTLLIGIEDEKLPLVLDLIRKNCAQRMEAAPVISNMTGGTAMYQPYQPQVLVGGATVFVTSVELYEKI